MHRYECAVVVFNGRYETRQSVRISASTWSTAVRRAIDKVFAERKQRGMSARMLERVAVQAIRLPGGAR